MTRLNDANQLLNGQGVLISSTTPQGAVFPQDTYGYTNSIMPDLLGDEYNTDTSWISYGSQFVLSANGNVILLVTLNSALTQSAIAKFTGITIANDNSIVITYLDINQDLITVTGSIAKDWRLSTD
jgi:hypothetical protein